MSAPWRPRRRRSASAKDAYHDRAPPSPPELDIAIADVDVDVDVDVSDVTGSAGSGASAGSASAGSGGGSTDWPMENGSVAGRDGDVYGDDTVFHPAFQEKASENGEEEDDDDDEFCSESEDEGLASSEEGDSDEEQSASETYYNDFGGEVWRDEDWEGVRVSRCDVELMYDSDDTSEAASDDDYGFPEVFADYYVWNDWGEQADRYLDHLDKLDEDGDSESDYSEDDSDNSSIADASRPEYAEEKVQNLEALRLQFQHERSNRAPAAEARAAAPAMPETPLTDDDDNYDDNDFDVEAELGRSNISGPTLTALDIDAISPTRRRHQQSSLESFALPGLPSTPKSPSPAAAPGLPETPKSPSVASTPPSTASPSLSAAFTRRRSRSLPRPAVVGPDGVSPSPPVSPPPPPDLAASVLPGQLTPSPARKRSLPAPPLEIPEMPNSPMRLPTPPASAIAPHALSSPLQGRNDVEERSSRPEVSPPESSDWLQATLASPPRPEPEPCAQCTTLRIRLEEVVADIGAAQFATAMSAAEASGECKPQFSDNADLMEEVIQLRLTMDMVAKLVLERAYRTRDEHASE